MPLFVSSRFLYIEVTHAGVCKAAGQFEEGGRGEWGAQGTHVVCRLIAHNELVTEWVDWTEQTQKRKLQVCDIANPIRVK